MRISEPSAIWLNFGKLFLFLFLFMVLTGCSSSLMRAAELGDIQQINSLIDQGANVNEKSVATMTPLMYAVSNRNASPSVIKLLIERGADVNATTMAKQSALYFAAITGNPAIVKILLDHGAKPNIASVDGYTPQYVANRSGHSLIAQMLSEAELSYYTKIPDEKSVATRPSHIVTPHVKKPYQSIITTKTDISSDDLLKSMTTAKPAGKYDVAVVIGNANYSTTGTPNVDFALQDAQAMKQYLMKTFGYDPANIIYLENATLAKMYEVFGTDSDYRGKLYKWVKPGQSQIFIYYVGHGAPDQQTGEGYFVPVDANPQYIRTSGYKLSTFYENLSRIPAAKKTVVIDACFSGSSANGQLLKGVSGLTARLKSEPKASAAADLLLTSAGMDQVSSWYPEKGHSLFTYFFLKGIQGDADTNKDGRITMGEMKAWLNDQVPYMARRLTGNEQQPVILGKDGDELVVLTR